jgi:DNA-binding transcriptional LysR family regulator
LNQDLDIALLRTFVAIVDTGGLTSAGRKVGRTQPAITHQISRLEDLIGRTLFDDNRRKLSLTQDGEILLEFARAMLRINDEARGRFSAPDIAGRVTLGTPDLYAPYILPDVLESFSRAHPNVEIQLRCTRSVHLHAALERNELDIALMTNQPEFRRGELVRREPLVWVAAIGSRPEAKAVAAGGAAAGKRLPPSRARGAGRGRPAMVDPFGLRQHRRPACRGVRRSCGLGIPTLRDRREYPPAWCAGRASAAAAGRAGHAPKEPGHFGCRRTARSIHHP